MMFSVSLLALIAGLVCARNNGVGQLPVMGYDTWNAFACNYDGGLTVQQAKLMNQTGLVAAGYKTFILDDCYANLARNSLGQLAANRTKFPWGMKHWTNIINGYGISGSAYTSNGYKTCAGYPGAYGYESTDLETFRSWGWHHMIKYDNCYIPYDNVTMENEYGRYARMMNAIDTIATKYNEAPFIYYLCQWGWQNPHNWAPRIAQSWRIDADIKPYWSSIANVLYLASTSYLATNFYQHADLDILEVGNNGRGTPPGNMTEAEERSHFTAWALLKSNLLIGTDLRGIPQASLDILLNTELIEINQDANEGQAIAPFRMGTQADGSSISYSSDSPPPYWAGNSTKGPIVMIINTEDSTQSYSFDLTENWAIKAGHQYNVRDMWKHADVGVAQRNWTVTLGAHDVAALLFTDAGAETVTSPRCAEPFLVRMCAFPNGTFVDPSLAASG